MTAALLCVAFALVVAGVALVYVPAGMVVAGLLVAAVGRFYHLGGDV